MDLYPERFWAETPLVSSIPLSTLLGAGVYLKLENLQPCQSFKARGVSHFAQHARRTHGADVHLIIASSGNAGLAAAWTANVLGVRCTIYIPHGIGETTIEFMRKQGANVIVHGNFYPEALQAAREAVARDPNAMIIPSYDDPLLWEGHASMVHEIRHQLPEGAKPAAILCSVGGGGLVAGIMTGLKAVGWDDVPLVTVETHGSNCFYQSLSLNDGHFSGNLGSRPLREGTRAEYCADHAVTVAHLSALTSRATSLGAASPSAAAVKMALQRSGTTKSVCIPDAMAMQTSLLFAEDHKILAELACAATLAPAYKPDLFRKLVPRLDGPVVFIVCGVKTSLREFAEFSEVVNTEVVEGGEWEILINGEREVVKKT